MTKRSDTAILLDIAIAARRAVSFVEGMALVDFQADLRTQSAVQHQLLILGEAAKRLSDETRASYGDIPWSSMSRMRDRLIHGYETVDLTVVWETVTVSLPNLLTQVDSILPKQPDT